MSFTAAVKAELAQRAMPPCCKLSTAYGVMLFAGRLSVAELRVAATNTNVRAAIERLFSDAFGTEHFFEFDNRALTVRDTAKLEQMFAKIGWEAERGVSLRINRGVFECDDCRSAFVSGAFMAAGTLAAPDKRYHLEISNSRWHVHRDIYTLLSELGLPPKTAERNGTYVTYFKRSAEIEDFLTLIGAPLSAMSVMNAKAEKELRGGVSRRVNCDTANADRTANSAAKQLSVIRALDLSKLPPDLRATAQLRLDNPDATLAELAELCKLSRPGLSHRFKRIIDLFETPQKGTM